VRLQRNETSPPPQGVQREHPNDGGQSTNNSRPGDRPPQLIAEDHLAPTTRPATSGRPGPAGPITHRFSATSRVRRRGSPCPTGPRNRGRSGPASRRSERSVAAVQIDQGHRDRRSQGGADVHGVSSCHPPFWFIIAIERIGPSCDTGVFLRCRVQLYGNWPVGPSPTRNPPRVEGILAKKELSPVSRGIRRGATVECLQQRPRTQRLMPSGNRLPPNPVTVTFSMVIVALEIVCTLDPSRRLYYYKRPQAGYPRNGLDGELWRPFPRPCSMPISSRRLHVYWLWIFGQAIEERLAR